MRHYLQLYVNKYEGAHGPCPQGNFRSSLLAKHFFKSSMLPVTGSSSFGVKNSVLRSPICLLAGVVAVLFFTCSVVSNSLLLCGLQHIKISCPSLSPWVCSNSCPLHQWYHGTISSSAAPFSSCLQSFPASGSFPRSQFFTSSGQSIGSFSFSISPSNEYLGLISFRMDWLDLLAVQGTLKSLLQHHSSKASILWRSAFFIVQLSHPYMTTEKNIALTRGFLCWQSNVSAF